MKKTITLYCKDPQSGKGEWRFQSHENGMNVLDPDDRVRYWFAHSEANERFDLPSFWRSVKHITFTTPKGTIVRFEPDREDVLIVQEYLDEAILADGIGGVNKLRRGAWLCLAGGIGLLVGCLGVAVLLDVVLKINNGQGNRYLRAFFVGAIVGIALIGWGGYGLMRSVRLLRRWKKDQKRKR